MQPVVTLTELTAFLHDAMPHMRDDHRLVALTDTGLVMEMAPQGRHLRPGGTVSGPAIFALADVAVYLAILSRIGLVPLAVTTSASIDFLRKPVPGTGLLAEVSLLKLGRRLAVGDVILRAAGMQEAVARATMTYSIPPERRANVG